MSDLTTVKIKKDLKDKIRVKAAKESVETGKTVTMQDWISESLTEALKK